MHIRAILIWTAFGIAVLAPIAVAVMSPLLQWRDPIYILGCFAGIVAMSLVLVQPLLVGGYLPGMRARRGRRLHALVGVALVMAVLVHVGGLWITSPPDMIDALLLASPTPFSIWGVIAMWALLAAALLAATRFWFRTRPKLWRLGHTALAALIVSCSAVHAMLVEGTMGTSSKAALCVLALAATLKVISDLRAWSPLGGQREMGESRSRGRRKDRRAAS